MTDTIQFLKEFDTFAVSGPRVVAWVRSDQGASLGDFNTYIRLGQ